MLCKGRPNQKMMNSILLFAAGMIMLFLGKGSWDIRQAFLLQQQTQEKRELCRQLCEDLSDSVDFLSESAGRFVISGDKEYLEAYWNEVRQGQRRNRIIESLQALELPGEEARLLETAKKNSDLLIYMETRSMKLAADAYGFPDSELPEEVSGYVLNVVEKQMSPGEKRLEAASILFGDNYRAEKEVITQYTDQFMERLSERMDKELGQVEDGVLQTTVRQWALQAAAFLLAGLILFLYYRFCISPVLQYQLCLKEKREKELRPAGTWEVYRLGNEIEAMYCSMQGALKTKDVFLGVVSHEIRTPLQTILGYQSLLEQTVQGKEQREYLDAMKDASFRLLQLVNHLLDASRLAAGQSQIQEEAFEVTDFIRELRNSFSRQAEEKGLYFSVGRGTDVPDVLRGDLMKIRQIAGNLITNGLKFTEKGRVTVNLGWEERAGEQFLLIKVRDSGIGIREEDKKRIFDVFEQADSSVSRRFGGSGLGLAVCRQLVGVLKGTLEVVSEPGKGSCFTAAIPVKAAEAAGGKQEAAEEEEDWSDFFRSWRELLERGDFGAEQYFRENKAVCQRIWGRERTEQIEREMDCYHFKTVAEWLEQWEKEGECHVSGTVCR